VFLGLDATEWAAWATVAAVLVALLGPVGHEWYKRKRNQPDLDLKVEQYGDVLSHMEPPARGITVALSNAASREAADNVEIFISGIGQRPDLGMLWHLAGQTPIAIGSATSTTVPANFSRLFAIGWIRSDLSETELQDFAAVGWLNTSDLTQQQSFMTGFKYDIHIAVTGSNFDAKFWQGRLEVRLVDGPFDKRAVQLVWLEEPNHTGHPVLVIKREPPS